jgi:GNAT superfamily N-acetyltransferase
MARRTMSRQRSNSACWRPAGWYRPAMDSTALARLEHANMINAYTVFAANADGAVVRRTDSVAVMSSGLPFVLFNQVIVEGDGATPSALASGIRLMRERGSPFVVNLRVGADDAFAAMAGELGLVPLSERPWMPGMAMHPASAESPVDKPGFEIRRAADDAGLDDHIRTAAVGFDIAEELIRAIVAPGLLDRDDVAVYVGYTDGEPVATGLGFRTGSAIGVYNIATIESCRGRGYGAAMTQRVVADGVATGCDVAILQSSEMGFPIYERLGFRTVVEYMGYVEPPAT